MEVDLIRIKDYPVSEGDFCIYNSSPAERLVLREFRTGKVCVPVDRPGNLHTRYRQHRRQNSTPTAMEAMKTSSLSATAMHQYASHRRGLSLDQRSQEHQRYQCPEDALSNPNMYQHPQHVLREAQQQRLTRPSPSYQAMPMSSSSEYQSFSQEDLQALTNHRSNENQFSENACMSPDVFTLDFQKMGTMPLKGDFGHFQQQQSFAKSGMPYGQFLDNSSWRYFSNENMAAMPERSGISDHERRMSVQSDIGPHAHRPSTPKKQISSNYLPITPATTPFRKSVDLGRYGQNMQSSPAKRNSISAVNTPESYFMQRAKSLQGVPSTSLTQPRINVPSPPNTASFDINTFDVFGSQPSSFTSSTSRETLQSKYHSPSSSQSSFHSLPEVADMPGPEEHIGKAPKVPISATPLRPSPKRMSSPAPIASPAKAKLSPRPASIDNLNLDARVHASITETGISIDEIASYISGPDPEDGKWVCLHPGCDRRFGRKENIKSHIQTHLGDRQYKCDHCDKCFVRGHDLKRHAKIHTGDKPYECLCGNVFARHDALTRHRQRGMCIGGYQGVVRKTTKRGRPKKNRPDMGERHDKAVRTRQRAAEKSSSVSVSGSDGSMNSPPTDVFENMSIRGSSPLDSDPMFHSEMSSQGLSSDVFTFTPPASPGCSTGNKPSPARSHRSITPGMEDDMLPHSPSKRPLENIPEEIADLPLLSEMGANTMSSPHTIPTLGGSTTGSDLDIFINQDAVSTFGKTQISSMNGPDMADFPEFDGLYPVKGMPNGPNLADDFFFAQFPEDQPSDVFSKEFFVD
ncbi:transcriptional regulator family: C2H2 zinc finger [Paecilomyces variotii]|nr:transcriptional regulator family: C2H2 zinc finger [Paecilomyces variotii]